MSDYLENELIKHIFRTGTYTKPTTVAIALCSAAVTDSDTGATIPEIANAGGYTRQTVNPGDANWSAVDDGTTKNVNAITWPVAQADWGTVTYIAMVDSATHGSGNVLFWGSLAGSKVVNNGDTMQIAANQFAIQIDN